MRFHSLRSWSVRTKLNFLFLCCTMVTLSVTVGAFVVNDVTMIKSSMADHMLVLGGALGDNCRSALVFEDQEMASETLGALKLDSSVVYACVYKNDTEEPFAQFGELPEGSPPRPEQLTDGHRFTDTGFLEAVKPIFENEEQVGSIRLIGSLAQIRQQLTRYAIIVACSLGVALVAILVVAFAVAVMISRPVQRVAHVLKLVAGGDYSQKVDINSGDEIGQMASSLNVATDAVAKAMQDVKDAAVREQQAQQQRTEAERRQAEAEHRRQEEEAERERLRIDEQHRREQEQTENERRQAEADRCKAEELRGKVDALLEVVGAAAEGDLIRQVDIDGEEPVDELAANAQEVSGAIQGISEVTEQTAAGSDLMATNSEQLEIQASGLRDLVRRFKTDTRTESKGA